MPERVLTEQEVSLNAVMYPISGQVTSFLASLYPQKLVLGDVTGDSQQRASTLRLADWRDGIGNFKLSSDEGPKTWWSTCQLRHKENLVLPQLATITAASGVTGVYTVGAIGELANEIYAAFGTAVRKYNNVTDSWGATLATLPAVATDAITARLGGTVYLIFAHTGGYTYTSDGITFTDDTKDTLYLAFWNDWLWGIDNTGLLWHASTIGQENDDAQLPLPNGSVNKLFVGRNATGEVILFAATRVGLYAHNFTETKWLYTEFELPFHPDNGRGSTRWRDSIYLSSGTGIYRYVQGNNQAIVTVMGLDLNDGVPDDKRGIVRQLVGSHNELLAITDATTAPGALANFDGNGGGAIFGADVIALDVGFSYIAGWDQRGWQIKWLGGSSTQAITAAHVSNAYDTYRLWWGHNQRIYFMPLQRDITNPSQVTTLTYAASSEHLTPWFNADQDDVNKLALSLAVEVTGATATETVAVDYATNYDNSNWTAYGTISSNGITTYLHPNSTTPTGTAFRAIRWRLTLARGSTTTLTPTVKSLTFVFRKKLPARWGHSFSANLIKEYKGKSPAELRSNLITAIESTSLVEFTYRDDTGDTRNFYVDVISIKGLEQTGHDERGVVEVMVAEP